MFNLTSCIRKSSIHLIRLIVLLVLLTQLGCSPLDKGTIKKVTTDDYELSFREKQNGLLILFPCFPCDVENTKTEFDIVEMAAKKGVAVLMMNFNRHLWLEEEEKKELNLTISQVIKEHRITTKNIFIGGFSSGGNVALLLSNYLKSTHASIQPKGLFIVDSPIDLLSLYEAARKCIDKNFSEIAVEEAKWIVNSFDFEFGKGDSSITQYKMKSPYTSLHHSIDNLSHLNDVQIRLYTEPDTAWWYKNRQTNYEDINAYYIEQLANDLQKKYGSNKVEYITSQEKGYRSNGERHPHSWSIVDKADLINWIVN